MCLYQLQRLNNTMLITILDAKLVLKVNIVEEDVMHKKPTLCHSRFLRRHNFLHVDSQLTRDTHHIIERL